METEEKGMEKKYIRIVSDRSETTLGVVLPDGRIVSMEDGSGRFILRFDDPFNIVTGEIMPAGTPCGGDVVSMNWLGGWRPEGKCGVDWEYRPLRRVQCYDICEFDGGEWRTLTAKRLDSIMDKFRRCGFAVDRQDVVDLFDSWHAGWKTGIRNERLGYHLFCPCGGNPFSVRLTTLHPRCSDWQKTYQC